MVGAIFNHPKGKATRDEDTSEGASNCPNKKKNKQRHKGSVVATTDRKESQKPTEGTLDHFEKLLKGPCLNHAFPIKHMYKDSSLMKRFFISGSKKWEQKKKPEAEADDAGEKDGGFPSSDGCLMIFSGPEAYGSKHR